MLEAHESECMKTPALLLFLELEGVLVLGASKKRELVADAVSNIARGDSTWRDHQGTWEGLFAAEPVRQLKALHHQFQLRYCLTTNWAGLLDKAAQALGFTLIEVGGLLTLDAACACTETRALAARKLSLIEQKMVDLVAMRQALGGLVQQCDAGTGGADCPIIDALDGAGREALV